MLDEKVQKGVMEDIIWGREGITLMMMQLIYNGARQRKEQSRMRRGVVDGEDDVLGEASGGSSSTCLAFY